MQFENDLVTFFSPFITLLPSNIELEIKFKLEQLTCWPGNCLPSEVNEMVARVNVHDMT